MALTTTTLAAACGLNDMTIRVTSATGFTPQQLIRVGDEMLAQNAAGSNGTTISVRRALEGTIATAHASGAVVQTGTGADFAAPPPGEVVAPTPSDASPVRQVTVTLTHAQILTLPSQSVTIVPAPGGTLGLIFLSAVVANHVTVSYGNRTTTNFNFYDPSSGSFWSAYEEAPINLLGTNEGYYVPFLPYAASSTQAVAPAVIYTTVGDGTLVASDSSIALRCFNATGNFTGGNAANRLTVTVLYKVYDMALGRFV